MARKTLPVVLTANDLMDGDVIWWTGSAWSRAFDSAARFATDADAAPTREDLGARPDVIGVYAVAIEPETGQPATRREAIRASREPSFAYRVPAPAGQREAA